MRTAAPAADGDYTMSVTGATGVVAGTTTEVTVLLDSSAGVDIDGWQYGVCESGPITTISVAPGLATTEGNGGGMVSFDVRGGLEASKKVAESVRLFALAESLGGVESMLDHPAIMTHASIPAAERHAAGLTDGLLRLSVGVEDLDDLLGDLDRALSGI